MLIAVSGRRARAYICAHCAQRVKSVGKEVGVFVGEADTHTHHPTTTVHHPTTTIHHHPNSNSCTLHIASYTDYEPTRLATQQ